jgi:hypothetical protein
MTGEMDMQRTNGIMRAFQPGHFLNLAAAAILLAACFPARSPAQQQGQKIFSSAQAASDALVAAVKSDDENALLEILGPDAQQIISSGDPVEDAANRSNFVNKYEEMHRLFREPDGTVTLYIGTENWPTPIPLVKRGDSWYFNTEAGKWEILYRRIGQNEMSAIRVCLELVAAEKEYYSTHARYAQKILSDEGQRNGLYWKAAEGEPESPIGPLVASAVAEGYTRPAGEPVPYRGYLYRVLKQQGKNAPGGAKSYLVNGNMTEGFAFVAYPAEYRSSGVVTFIVNQDGVVLQQDLGQKTGKLASVMKVYNPESKWQKAGQQDMESAAQQKVK